MTPRGLKLLSHPCLPKTLSALEIGNTRRDGKRCKTIPPTEEASAGAAMGDVTRVRSRMEGGDGKAADQLLPLVSDELRKLER